MDSASGHIHELASTSKEKAIFEEANLTLNSVCTSRAQFRNLYFIQLALGEAILWPHDRVLRSHWGKLNNSSFVWHIVQSKKSAKVRTTITRSVRENEQQQPIRFGNRLVYSLFYTHCHWLLRSHNLIFFLSFCNIHTQLTSNLAIFFLPCFSVFPAPRQTNR